MCRMTGHIYTTVGLCSCYICIVHRYCALVYAYVCLHLGALVSVSVCYHQVCVFISRLYSGSCFHLCLQPALVHEELLSHSIHIVVDSL